MNSLTAGNILTIFFTAMGWERAILNMNKNKLISWLLKIWAVVGITCMVVTPLLYVQWNGFIEQGGVTFSAVSWLLAQGHPLYTGLDSAERYSIQHGPIIYLVTGMIMKVFGPSYLTAKLASVIALQASLIISWLWFSQLTIKRYALYILGLECWILLHWTYSYLNRPDSMMLLCVVVGMFIATTKRNKLWLILGTAIPLGIMMNLKIHGFIYFLPVIVMVYPHVSWKNILLISGIALILGIAPFLLPQISLINYMTWLTESIRHGILWENILAKVSILCEWLLIPITVGVVQRFNVRAFYQRHQRLIVTGVVSLIIPVVIGSKAGSGTYHLIPSVPVFCYIMVMLAIDVRKKANYWPDTNGNTRLIKLSYSLLAVIFITITVSGINGEQRVLKPVLNYGNRWGIIREVQSIEKMYPGKTMEIGYGEEKVGSAYRDVIPIPVFHGNPYLVDKVALGDMSSSGLSIPSATIRKLEEGAIHVWLIPRENQPFSLHEFDDTFRQTFLNNYTLVSRNRFFDVWVYRNAAEAAKENSDLQNIN